MNNPTITKTRADVLRAIADPNIEVYASLGSSFNTSWLDADVWVKNADGTRRKVTKTAADLEQAGLVERAPIRRSDPDAPYGRRNSAYRYPRDYTITEAGRQALAAYDTDGK